MNLLPKRQSGPVTVEPEDCADESVSPTALQKFDQLYESAHTHITQNTQDFMSFREQLLALEDRCYERCDTDVLDYWSKFKCDIELEMVAMVALAVPVTQVTVERSFSQMSLMLTDKRTMLSNDSLKKGMLLRLNGYYF